MGGKHRRLQCKTIVFVLLVTAIPLAHCSSLVNPDPDSLTRRDGGDMDTIDGADLQEDEGLTDPHEEDGMDAMDVPDDGAVDPIEDTPEEEIIVTDCTGHPNFTPCIVVTDPDRDYDICIGGECLSPGCGDESCNPPGPHFSLPDTNQRACYDETEEITCPGTPGDPTCAITDGCGQDAQCGWDTAHDPSERFTVTGSAEPLVTDNITDLMWQGCPAGQSGSDCAGEHVPHTWIEALAYCDGLTWGGHDDWRMPDRHELQSIVDYGRTDPSIDSSAFPGTPTSFFWSLSSVSGESVSAWVVPFNDGRAGRVGKDGGMVVRCVRGGVECRERFSLSEPVTGEPVVTDNITDIVWQGCPEGKRGRTCTGSHDEYNWHNALSNCEGLSWGGHEDWRLPDIKELASIVDDHSTEPCIDAFAFPGTPSVNFWSSSSSAGSPSNAWIVDFSSGIAVNDNKVNVTEHAVRCVRLGP